MSDYYLGEVRIVAFPFAPHGWANCDGQSMTIQQNQALYALLGVQFGGNGQTTFNLPDLRGRVPMHTQFHSSGGSQGTAGGVETVTLAAGHLPPHNHTFMASSTNAASVNLDPNGAETIGSTVLATTGEPANIYFSPIAQTTPLTPLNPVALLATGGGQGHANMQPSLVLRFTIALTGYFPSRN